MPTDHPLIFGRLFFAILLCTVFPMLDLPPLLKLRRFTSEKLRVRVYQRILVILWFTAGLAVCLCWPRNLLRVPQMQGWVAGLGVGSAVGVALAGLVPAVMLFRSPATRRRAGKMMQALTFLLPVTTRERRLWLAISITAGVCEELLYRGFLLPFLLGNVDPHPHMDLWPALLLQAVFFGLAHVYQGWSGVIGSALLGVVFGLMCLGTGSLWLAIVVHALLDARVLPMYRPTLDDPERAAALVAGTRPVLA